MVSKKQKAKYEAVWERGFFALKAFKRKHGHCLVPRHHVQGNHRLGQWVTVQRYWKANLASERRKRLEAIGFIWSRRDYLWETKFAALKAFKTRHGHCLVPTKNNPTFGYWVSTQRPKKRRMSKERRKKLERVGFIWDAQSRH
jgi:hypothetical protein